MLRTILGVGVGMLLGVLVIAVVEFFGHSFFGGIDASVDINDKEAMKEMMNNLPIGTLLFVPLAYAFGSLVAGLLSTLISEKRYNWWPAIISGLILMSFGIVNFIQYPGPLWITVIGLLVFLPFAFLGYKMVNKY